MLLIIFMKCWTNAFFFILKYTWEINRAWMAGSPMQRCYNGCLFLSFITWYMQELHCSIYTSEWTRKQQIHAHRVAKVRNHLHQKKGCVIYPKQFMVGNGRPWKRQFWGYKEQNRNGTKPLHLLNGGNRYRFSISKQSNTQQLGLHCYPKGSQILQVNVYHIAPPSGGGRGCNKSAVKKLQFCTGHGIVQLLYWPMLKGGSGCL